MGNSNTVTKKKKKTTKEKEKDYFKCWCGRGFCEGLIFQDGAYFRWHQGAYVMSTSFDTPSYTISRDETMFYLKGISNRITDFNLIKDIVSYHVDLCWSTITNIKLTKKDKQTLDTYKHLQTSYYFKNKFKVSNLRLRPEILVKTRFYTIEFTNTSLIFRNKFINPCDISIPKKVLQSIAFEHNPAFQALLVDLILLYAKKSKKAIFRSEVMEAFDDLRVVVGYLGACQSVQLLPKEQWRIVVDDNGIEIK